MENKSILMILLRAEKMKEEETQSGSRSPSLTFYCGSRPLKITSVGNAGFAVIHVTAGWNEAQCFVETMRCVQCSRAIDAALTRLFT